MMPGNRLQIDGCTYNFSVPIPKDAFYWLKDGTERFEATISSSDLNKIQPLIFPVAHLTHEGSYRCVTFHPTLMGAPLQSNPADVVFKGKTGFKIAFPIDSRGLNLP